MANRSLDTILTLPDVKKGNTRLAALIREAHSLRDAEARLKDVRKEIADIVSTQGLTSDDGSLGARVGHQAAFVRWQSGRRTFNRELAIEAGITPGQIEAAMKEGEGY